MSDEINYVKDMMKRADDLNEEIVSTIHNIPNLGMKEAIDTIEKLNDKIKLMTEELKKYLEDYKHELHPNLKAMIEVMDMMFVNESITAVHCDPKVKRKVPSHLH